MGKVERGVVRPPNKPVARGDDRNNGFLSLADRAPAIHDLDLDSAKGDRRAGSFSLAPGAPEIRDTQRKFNVDEVPGSHSPLAWPDEPGKGVVPVNPFMPGGAAARSVSVADDARARPGR